MCKIQSVFIVCDLVLLSSCCLCVCVCVRVCVCLSSEISLTVRGVEQLAWSGTANAEESGTCCSRLTLDLWWVRSSGHFGESLGQVTLRRPFFGELYWRWGMNLTRVKVLKRPFIRYHKGCWFRFMCSALRNISSEVWWTSPMRGERSHHKVYVGELAEGPFTHS